MTYSWINSTITGIDLVPSVDDVAHITRERFDGKFEAAQFSYSALSTLTQSNTPNDLAFMYSRSLEKLILALTANVWKPLGNQEEQLRRELLVSKVPKAPFFTLISLCLLFAFFCFVVFLFALKGLDGNARNVQARLNIFGVTASRFEDPRTARNEALEDLFEERKGEGRSARVGMIKEVGGGWSYVSSRAEEMEGMYGSRVRSHRAIRDD